MNFRKYIPIFLLIIQLTSCGKTIRLADEDFKWIPYKGTETLVFSSTIGDTDTIYLSGSDRQTVPSDPLDVFPTELEHYTIAARHSDPAPSDGSQHYINSIFLELSASEDKSPYLTINHLGKDAWFYGGDFMELKDLDTLQLVSLVTKLKTYHDIVLLYPESYEYSGRSDFITRICWSKSEGLIRYDKKDSIYWELTRKYSP